MSNTITSTHPPLTEQPGAATAGGATIGHDIPAHVIAVLLASVSVVVGVLWDISWHSSIGRDTFFSPPHLAMYLGGVVAGVTCGWKVLHTTYAGTPEERASGVTFWKYFRGPLGAWVCIWGALAMLTSAPFDNWWHNAYGLDVKILSPPHAVLALGILAIELGALFMVLALQNRDAASDDVVGSAREGAFYPTTGSRSSDERVAGTGASSSTTAIMFAFAAGLVLLNVSILATEYTFRIYQHGTLFYQIASGLFLLPLAAAGVAGRVRWPITAAAATYMGVLLALHFVLPLFPAEPRLAPVLFRLDRMIPPQFPLLLVVPAVAMDFAIHRWGARPPGWLLAGVLSAVFLVTFVAVQWPFADFLQSDLARNGVFKQDLRPYMIDVNAMGVRGIFYMPSGGIQLLRGLFVALVIGTLSARLGLGAGRWMSGVRR